MYKRAFSGSKVEPKIVMDIMFYTYCSVFHISPVDALHTPIGLIKKMLSIHGEFKAVESAEIKKITKR